MDPDPTARETRTVGSGSTLVAKPHVLGLGSERVNKTFVAITCLMLVISTCASVIMNFL